MINWHEQWAQFAEGFREGHAHIDLTPFGSPKTLKLAPGPGFGDLSHPTTRLMLRLMIGRIQNQKVLDVGCGSGILSLAALLLGAKSALGIDIDLEALEHARQNAKLNHLKARFTPTVPPQTPPHDLALMNMILSEQQVAMSNRQTFRATTWVTSGILQKQRSQYLQITQNWQWELVTEEQEGEWLGFVFSCKAALQEG